MEAEIKKLFGSANYYINPLGDYKKALDCCDKILKMSPNDSKATYLKVDCLFALRRYDDAKKTLDNLVRNDKSNSEAWALRAGLLIDLGQFSEAITSSDNAIKLLKNSKLKKSQAMLIAQANKGMSYSFLGRFEEAIACFDEAIKINPKDAKLWREKGRAHFQLQENNDALNSFNRALRIDPNLTGVYDVRAEVLRQLGKFDAALESYDRNIQLLKILFDQTNNSQYMIQILFTLYEKGATLQGLQMHPEAIECFDNGLEISPKDSMLWLSKAISLHNLTQFDEATECFDNAIELAPKDHEYSLASMVWPSLAKETVTMIAWESKGNILMMQGRSHESGICFDNLNNLVKKLSKKDQSILFERHEGQRNIEKEIEAIDDALRGEPIE